MTNWTHKVVKRMRGMDGKMFDFPTAGTFGSESEAREYAESFANSQRESGVSGAEITMRTRRGACSTGRGEIIATYRSQYRLSPPR